MYELKEGRLGDMQQGANVLGFEIRCSDLAKLMETGRVEGADKTLTLDQRTALVHLEKLGGVEGVAAKLGCDVTTGIDSTTIQERTRVFGPNQIDHERAKTYLQLCWEAAQDSTLIMLGMAATLSLVLETSTADGDDLDTSWIEGVAIFATVIIVVNVTAFNDFQKEKQFRALKAEADASKVVAVIRDGEPLSIDVKPEAVVVGDVVDVRTGDVLGADGILIVGNGITVDEAAMTGESKPRTKDITEAPWLFAGTSIQTGEGHMLVTAVGINSAEGIINALVTGSGGDEKVRQKQVEEALQLPHLFDTQATTRASDAAVEHSERRSQQKGRSESVLALKLEKLSWSLGALAAVIAAMCLFGLIIRLLISTYSDCDGCDNDGWDVGKWRELVSFFITAVTVLVVAIPEGLPLAVTISLAYSVRQMQKDMCLVRVLASCETMGNAQCICSDKTGTLTQNKMSVQVLYIDQKIFGDSEPGAKEQYDAPFAALHDLPNELLLSIAEDGALNSSHKTLYVPKVEAHTGGKGDQIATSMDQRIQQSRDFVAADIEQVEQVGSKTECAILLLGDQFYASTKLSYVNIRDSYPVPPAKYGFNRKTKRSSAVVARPDGSTIFAPGSRRLYVKGAPQYLLSLCNTVVTRTGVKDFTAEDKAEINESVINLFARQAFRVLLLAYRDVGPDLDINDEDTLVCNLTLLCITGIMDPPRPEVLLAIKACHGAGVTVRMVTGDAKETAIAIAVKIGLCTQEEAEEEGTVWMGKDFSAAVYNESTDTIDYAACSKIWPKLKVMGRCDPRDKFNLVSALIHDGEVVAVTGDGTNDAPALAKADVGFSMGLAGTDVAKAASDIVLLDDNFASIVKAISWGRNVYDSISKFLVFQLTVTVVSVAIEFVGSLAIGAAPLRATQLIWVNLIMDTFASLALASEQPVPAQLKRNPNKRDDPLLTKHMAKQILGHAVYQLTVSFALLFAGHEWFDLEDGTKLAYDDPPSEHLTLVFNTFVWMTLFNQLNVRRIDGNLYVFRGLLTNPTFLFIMAFEVLGQALVVEFGGYAMRTHSQSGELWACAIAFGAGSLLWNVVLHYVFDDEWIPQRFIDLFKVTLNTTDSEPPRGDNAVGVAPTDEIHRKSSVIPATKLETVGSFVSASKRVQSQLKVVKMFRHDDLERHASASRRWKKALQKTRRFSFRNGKDVDGDQADMAELGRTSMTDRDAASELLDQTPSAASVGNTADQTQGDTEAVSQRSNSYFVAVSTV